MTSSREAREGFSSRFGSDADGVWSAPGRVNLIGEHTDYNQGLVLPFAIDRRTYAALRLRDDRRIRVASDLYPGIEEFSLDRSVEELPATWIGYPVGVAFSILDGVGNSEDFRGFDLYITTDVPEGAGLSSSAALECSVGLALTQAWGITVSRPELALIAQRAENVVVGAPTGFMDQFASLLGQENHAVFLDCQSREAQAVELGFVENDIELLVIDTKERHEHATGGYAARRASCEKAVELLGLNTLRDLDVDDLCSLENQLDEETLRRVRHVVTENERVRELVTTMRNRGPSAGGQLLVDSHASMRDDFEISTPALNLAVEAACAAGALGARMTGGGFGGAAIAMVTTAQRDAVAAAVNRAFEQAGLVAPDVFTVVPSDGARKEES